MSSFQHLIRVVSIRGYWLLLVKKKKIEDLKDELYLLEHSASIFLFDHFWQGPNSEL